MRTRLCRLMYGKAMPFRKRSYFFMGCAPRHGAQPTIVSLARKAEGFRTSGGEAAAEETHLSPNLAVPITEPSIAVNDRGDEGLFHRVK